MAALLHWSRKVGLVVEIHNCLRHLAIAIYVDHKLPKYFHYPENSGSLVMTVGRSRGFGTHVALSIKCLESNTEYIHPTCPFSSWDDGWSLLHVNSFFGMFGHWDFQETEFLTEPKKLLPNNSLQSSQTIDRTNKETNKNWRFGVSSFMWTGR